jgi:RNA polymerase sigma factor (sigma-70 family)
LTLETNIVADSAATDQVLNLDAALEGLAKFDRRLAEVVELRYFAGLTNGEIAETLGVNERTVRRDWDKARLLLHRELVPDLGRN